MEMGLPKRHRLNEFGTLCKKKMTTEVVINFAESTGFEPVDTLRYRQFSKLLVSATHPTLRSLNP